MKKKTTGALNHRRKQYVNILGNSLGFHLMSGTNSYFRGGPTSDREILQAKFLICERALVVV